MQIRLVIQAAEWQRNASIAMDVRDFLKVKSAIVDYPCVFPGIKPDIQLRR